jgi:hypothetical protein
MGTIEEAEHSNSIGRKEWMQFGSSWPGRYCYLSPPIEMELID